MKTIVLALALSVIPAVSGAGELFLTSDNCMACHNGMVSSAGEDHSIGTDFRPTMMANAARDPYWQAGVRRETLDHPAATAAIENECSRCHMPMANVVSRSNGGKGAVFANLGRAPAAPTAALASDGVSCTLCHQIQPDNLGTPASLVGGFSVDVDPSHPRKAFGPFQVKEPVARLMASATTFTPHQATHLRSSELCATCHTLITEALGPDGSHVGRLPEQVPYQEWQHSQFSGKQGCVDCHMPALAGPAPIANLFSDPRPGLSRHAFLGGNFVVPGILKALGEPGPALPSDFSRDMDETRGYLAGKAARVSLADVRVVEGKVEGTIRVESLAGHKLPTAYPSRRVWLRVMVKDAKGVPLFESGAVDEMGRIVGNDNDTDGTRFEPHHEIIALADDVQIYESILGASSGQVTTGLLQATTYLKDNRIPPRGFDKTKAPADVSVVGDALGDGNFTGGSDEVRLSIALPSGKDAALVEVELWYQPIGYRWAENLRVVQSAESKRFARGFDKVRGTAQQRLAVASATLVP